MLILLFRVRKLHLPVYLKLAVFANLRADMCSWLRSLLKWTVALVTIQLLSLFSYYTKQ